MKTSDFRTLAYPYRGSLLALVWLTIGSSLVLLSVPWLAGQLIGGVLIAQLNTGRLVAMLLAVLTLLALLNFATYYVSSATSARILADLRVRIYAHLQALPLGFHQVRRQGDLLALATFEVGRLGSFFTSTLVSFPSRLLTAAGAVVLMFRMDARLALLIPLLIPAFFIVLKLVGRRLRTFAVAAQRAEADVLATVEENLHMLPVIKSFAREDSVTRRYAQHAEHAMRCSVRQGRVHATLEPSVALISGAAAVLLLFLAGKSLSAGAMSNTQLFSFLFYAALLTRPVGSLAHAYGDFQAARGTLARLQDVLREAVEPGYAAERTLPAPSGRLSFVGVEFSYPGRPPLLRDVTLDIAAGEKIALVGDNGAGKTTLMDLVLRFMPVDGGSIMLDGVDISTLQVQHLRRRIGLVPQRAHLVNGTIRANIVYGVDHATDEQVMRAAQLSQALDFILALPNGFETEIGDGGVRLSGGQRQRISLARALILDPPILLLDEATSMYDVDGEEAFVAACRDGLRGRTVLFTTHRPASLAIADRIICVTNGTVREVSHASMGTAVARQGSGSGG